MPPKEHDPKNIEADMKTIACSRRQLLLSLPVGLSSPTLLAMLSACGNQNTGGAIDGNVSAPNGQAQITFAAFPVLMTVGGSVVVSANGAPIAVARTGLQTAVALSAVCTHAGCTVAWENGDTSLFCPCHGSSFAVSGAVTGGPAPAPLAVYPATVTNDGITIQLA